jgi:hypothetical protein
VGIVGKDQVDTDSELGDVLRCDLLDCEPWTAGDNSWIDMLGLGGGRIRTYPLHSIHEGVILANLGSRCWWRLRGLRPWMFFDALQSQCSWNEHGAERGVPSEALSGCSIAKWSCRVIVAARLLEARAHVIADFQTTGPRKLTQRSPSKSHNAFYSNTLPATMPKEKNYNPVQDHKKAEKQKQIKKQKATVQAQRNEKLARRNPNRLQRDIDNLKEADQSGGLRPHDRQRLSELEKDLAAVNKARAALGDKAPQFKPERERRDDGGGDRGGRGGHRGGGGVLGKRTRDGQRKDEDSSDTDADVKNIPMPRDTPPPIPHKHNQQSQAEDAQPAPKPKKAQIVYEAAPQIRDFLKEATKFMPTAVANKMKMAKGEGPQGKLLEPEEFDKLQDEGYMAKKKPGEVRTQGTSMAEDIEQAAEAAVQEAEFDMMAAEAGGDIQGIGSEAAVAENILRHVEIEEVVDEDL